MRNIIIILLSVMFVSTASAVTIKMFGQSEYGFNQPRYELDKQEKKIKGNILKLAAFADDDHFPFSSKEQGSVFYKLFASIKEESSVDINVEYLPNKYKEEVVEFERGHVEEYNALFGVYYKELPLSHNKYIYPAIGSNNVHIITPSYKKLNITGRDNLKNYKGVYASEDKFSDIVLRDLKKLQLKEVPTFAAAFETMLSGQADYIAASYYPGLIESYKLGIKNYVAFSQDPVWTMPIFIRVKPEIMRAPQMEYLVQYLKSSRYKKQREAAFEEVIEIYKNNTIGIVPPTYINVGSTEEESETKTDAETQSEDNKQL